MTHEKTARHAWRGRKGGTGEPRFTLFDPDQEEYSLKSEHKSHEQLSTRTTASESYKQEARHSHSGV